MFNYFKDCVTSKYADFIGRSRRSEFWYFTLFNTIFSWIFSFVVASFLVGANNTGGDPTTVLGASLLGSVYSLATFVPTLAVGTRRLHDIGKSGWYQLLWFFILIGWIWLIVLFCTDSQTGENEYGPNPKGIGNGGTADELINSIGSQS